LVVVGGHTRSIGKTELVCQLIAALPAARWLAGKITQYGHGVCAQNGRDCDCAPTEHAVALDWELPGRPLTKCDSDSARFIKAGAQRAFWLRTKQGFLAEGLPLLRGALSEAQAGEPGDGLNVIIESNSLLQFVKPSLYVTVVDAGCQDFKHSARLALDRADVILFRRDPGLPGPPWKDLLAQLTREKLSLLQREGEALPEPLLQMVKQILGRQATVAV
jgi:hypothetical protein